MIALPIQTEPLSWEPSWFAVQTRYRFEKKVAEQLHSKGVEIFAPVRREVHHWSDRRKVIPVPLFSGYIFVRLQASLASRLAVLRTEGVIAFVNFQGTPTAIPGKQIEHLQRLLAQDVPCSLHAFLKAGSRVRIRGGSLDGLEGILAQNGPKSLVISIECIERSVAIEIEGYELELA
ncbi:MAG TPA: UpxY family transcription antiterminator [Terriglobales bacterium]|nr:UpxY family transcription antiterminator [Terriglobales bacterium]